MERNALFFDMPKLGKRKNLKTAAVGQDRTVPCHKPMKPAHIANQLIARPNMQVIGIGQFDLASDLLEIFRRQSALNCRLCTDVHEHRRLHRAVRRLKGAAPSAAVLF